MILQVRPAITYHHRTLWPNMQVQVHPTDACSYGEADTDEKSWEDRYTRKEESGDFGRMP